MRIRALLVGFALFATPFAAFAQDDEDPPMPEDAAAAPAPESESDQLDTPDEPATPEAAPVPEPPAPAAAPSAPAPAAPSPEGSLSLDKTSQPRMFGKYRIRLGIANPKFDDGLKFYKELYGNPRGFPMLNVDYFPIDFLVTAGIGLRMGYYSDEGFTAKPVAGKDKKDYEASEVNEDRNGPASMTLVPLQVGISAEFSPFERKWIVLDAFLGYEKLYWWETRTVASESKAPTGTKPAALMAAATGSDDALVNKGEKSATVLGLALNILLNPIDEATVLAARGTLGIGAVYLSPYLEIVRTLSKENASFGRTSMGLGFTFESAR